MRSTFTIPGGIHPAENKIQSLTHPIQAAGIPSRLVIPVAQHIGAPASPIVQIGDKVLKGQCLAEANGFVSVPVHAPTSGTVTDIAPHAIAHPSGMQGLCIIIEPDNKDEWCALSPCEQFSSLEKNDLLQKIRDAGIAGMGGAGFPAAVKLAGKPGSQIDTLIINGTECEPYITADDILMRERPEVILGGIDILVHLIQPKEVLIGIEDNKPEAIASMQTAMGERNYEIVSFHTKYPSGGEKQLIQILTDKEVPSAGLPADIGVVLQNIGTAAAVHNAVVLGEPLISRITTVTGDAVAQAQNYDTLIGTPVEYLFAKSGLTVSKASRLIMGGPMMGFTLLSTDVPVVKTTNCLLAPTQEEVPTNTPAQACIRCGMCAEACPASLLPQQLYWFSRSKELDRLEEHNLNDCIECGCCSYVCPSQIPLVQYYRASKSALREHKLDQQKADASKERFEFRQLRLEQEEAEKEAKRAARKKAADAKKAKPAPAKKAPDGGDKTESADDVIAAAVARAAAKKAAKQTEIDKPSVTTPSEPNQSAIGDSTANEPSDAAQQAIERAKNARAGNKPSAEEQKAKLEKRLQAAQEKLQKAESEQSEHIDAYRNSVQKLEAKVQAFEETSEAKS